MGYKKNPHISKHDIHPLDGLFYYIGSRWVMLPLWLSSIALGVIISVNMGDWAWLAKFGAMGVMIGTILTLSPLFRRGIYLSNADAFNMANFDEDQKVTVTSVEGSAISINIIIGIAMIIFSSTINAFGDYLVKMML